MTDRDLLEGIRILDLTHVLAGPFATMTLGDLGAEVIKVESPRSGDHVRDLPPYVGDQSHYFLAINRNKRSFACDLKDDRVRKIVQDIAATADVVIDNFRPGVTERLGLGHAQLLERNPDVITCSITGFGSDPQWADRPSFDLVNQALAGIMSVNGEPDGPALKVGVPIGDLTGGLWATIAILSALQKRNATGRGCHVEISLTDGLLGLLGYLGQMALLDKRNPERVGNRHHAIVPYGRFETRDGALVLALHVGDFWRLFADAVGRADLIEDPRFRTTALRKENRDELEEIVRAVMVTRDTAEWEQILVAIGVPHAPILGVYDALTSDYVQLSGILKTMHHPTAGDVQVVATPIRVDGEHAAGANGQVRPSPRLGEGMTEILSDFGVTDTMIAEMVDAGVVAPLPTDPIANDPSSPEGVHR